MRLVTAKIVAVALSLAGIFGVAGVLVAPAAQATCPPKDPSCYCPPAGCPAGF